MGLAGASKKQRIQDDPRNLRWAQDTSAPGFRLLASMGWNPDSNPTLGNAESQAAIIANGGSVFSARKIAAIPLAKDDTLGIGMKRGTGAQVAGSLRAIGVAPASGANAVGSGTSSANAGFVAAGSGSATPRDGVTGGGSGGGEFGNLLARLNKLKEMNGGTISQSSASPSPAPEVKKRKRSGSASSSSSSSSSESDSDSSDNEEASAGPIASTSASPALAPAAAPSAAALAILKNPRMAARSKHLRAKRLATASNSSAMAEILGLAPSASESPASSLAGSPAPAVRPALAVNGPRADGWPSVPDRGSSAIVSKTMLASETPTESATTSGDEKARRKADKAAEKAEKEVRRAEKAAKKAAKSKAKASGAGSDEGQESAPARKERSPSPEFKVHSAQHDPFKVSSDVPTASSQPTGLASIFGSMFARSSSGGMGATFVPPSTAAPSTVPATITVTESIAPATAKVMDDTTAVEANKSDKKSSKKRKSSRADEDGAGEAEDKAERKTKRKAEKEVVADEAGETKEERKARKEAKKAKKAAKKAKAEKA